MSRPSVVHRTCAVPRTGSGNGEYEDAASISAEEWPVCAAVADGATESMFSRAWAEILARRLVDQSATTPEAFEDRLPDWQQEWKGAIRERSEERPWYVAAKVAEGSFATLLGLSLRAGGQWQAVSVGDCCLFQVRKGALVQSWPYERPDAFTTRPALVPSHSDRAVPLPETTSGTWHPQDTFLLATDAVAAWLLGGTSSEGAGSSWDPTVAAGWNEETFHRAVETARAGGSLRNDDATLLVLHVDPEADPSENAATRS